MQLAVFLCGAIAAPVWHLASHRPDHTHGADASTTVFHVHAAGPEGERDHHHHDDVDHEIELALAPPEAARTSPVSTPLGHGHGSLAHFGVALLGAPPLVPLPAPEPRPESVVSASLEPLSFFQPAFPLPRPPPTPA